MSREKFPERIEIAAPRGTKDRLLRMLGIDATDLKSGMAGPGPKLRAWLLDLLARSETGNGVNLGTDKQMTSVPKTADGEDSHIALALQLLADPDQDVRRRVIQSLKICEDFRDRRRRKAAGREIVSIGSVPVHVYVNAVEKS